MIEFVLSGAERAGGRRGFVWGISGFVVCFGREGIGMDGAPVAEFRPTMTHGGRFLLYNIFGNQFEITAKYQPPIMPIGRGAYGIVWYVLILARQHQSPP